MKSKFVGVTGLPRAGSTLLCQRLGQHPDIHCEGHSSPLCNTLQGLRELGQIYGSIEAQHQKTILIDFIDHFADYDRFGRADMLFAKDKSIGAPLISLHAVPGSRYFCESFYGPPQPNKRQKLRDRSCLRRPQPSCFIRWIPDKGYPTSFSQ